MVNEGRKAAKRTPWNLRLQMSAGLILLLALGAVALAACGGDGGGEKTAAPTNQQRATNTAATPSSAAATRAPATAAAPRTPAAPTRQGGGNTASSDACALVTKEDAAAALGESVQDPQSASAGSQQLGSDLTVDVTSCSYDSPTTTHSVALGVWLAPSEAADALRQSIEFVCSGKESISGLGDVACWYSSEHGELQVAKGAAFLDLTMQAGQNVDTTEPLKTLAQKALARLP